MSTCCPNWPALRFRKDGHHCAPIPLPPLSECFTCLAQDVSDALEALRYQDVEPGEETAEAASHAQREHGQPAPAFPVPLAPRRHINQRMYRRAIYHPSDVRLSPGPGAAPMPIHGINHVTIIVRDMDRTVQLFVQALGAREEYRSPEREYSKYPETFLRIGDLWLVVMEDAHIQRARSYDHIALGIDLEAVPEVTRRLIEAGAEVVPSRPRIGAESASVYFYDFDNHLFELHAGDIADRLRHYAAARQGV